jgi:hypothetical protein
MHTREAPRVWTEAGVRAAAWVRELATAWVTGLRFAA